MNIFEKASKQSLRFETNAGLLSTEDLWTLPLSALDTLAVSYKNAVESENVESFIKPAPSKSRTLQLQLDITKRIIEVRLEDNENRKTAADKRVLREKVKEAIANKEDSALQGKSLAALNKMLEES